MKNISPIQMGKIFAGGIAVVTVAVYSYWAIAGSIGGEQIWIFSGIALPFLFGVIGAGLGGCDIKSSSVPCPDWPEHLGQLVGLVLLVGLYFGFGFLFGLVLRFFRK